MEAARSDFSKVKSDAEEAGQMLAWAYEARNEDDCSLTLDVPKMIRMLVTKGRRDTKACGAMDSV